MKAPKIGGEPDPERQSAAGLFVQTAEGIISGMEERLLETSGVTSEEEPIRLGVGDSLGFRTTYMLQGGGELYTVVRDSLGRVFSCRLGGAPGPVYRTYYFGEVEFKAGDSDRAVYVLAGGHSSGLEVAERFALGSFSCGTIFYLYYMLEEGSMALVPSGIRVEECSLSETEIQTIIPGGLESIRKLHLVEMLEYYLDPFKRDVFPETEVDNDEEDLRVRREAVFLWLREGAGSPVVPVEDGMATESIWFGNELESKCHIMERRDQPGTWLAIMQQEGHPFGRIFEVGVDLPEQPFEYIDEDAGHRFSGTVTVGSRVFEVSCTRRYTATAPDYSFTNTEVAKNLVGHVLEEAMVAGYQP